MLWKSPRLDLESLDGLDSIVVAFSDVSRLRGLSLLWTSGDALSSADALRNHRELLDPAAPPPRVFRVSGDEVAYVPMRRDEPREPIRHLFLRLPAAAAPPDEVALLSKLDWMSAHATGHTRFSQAGETRVDDLVVTLGLEVISIERVRVGLRGVLPEVNGLPGVWADAAGNEH